jgi:pimeloyl-ACP methyl ester carboxylesterase
MSRSALRVFGGMSRRRQSMFMAAAAIALAVGVLAVVVRVVGSDLGANAHPVPAQDRPGAVLLVPGYGGGTAGLDVLAGALRANGRTATVVGLPGDATGDLRQQADALDAHVVQALNDGAPSVDVVGYSAGGVVARLWAQEHDGASKARRVVTLGSPHHGTQLAAAGSALAPGACPTACQQLAPGSRLLAELSGPVPTPPRWLSVWTEQDQTVTPPDSARLDGALNVVVQQVCPGRRVSHAGLPTDGFVAALVLDALGAGPIAAPDPAECNRA